jgi:hypothetical protein
MRATGAPDGGLEFQAPIVITQLRVRNTRWASYVETDDGVAGGIAPVYRPNLQTEPERTHEERLRLHTGRQQGRAGSGKEALGEVDEHGLGPQRAHPPGQALGKPPQARRLNGQDPTARDRERVGLNDGERLA